MPWFKELAFFADNKRKVVKTHRHTITAPKVVVIFTQVRANVLCLKTVDLKNVDFVFVSFKVFFVKQQSHISV